MEPPEGANGAAAEAAGVFVYVTQETQGYEKADTGSGVVAALAKDKKLLMVQKVDDEWRQVVDAGQTMYVQAKYLREAPADEELAREMQELEVKRAEEVEKDIEARRRAAQGRMWGIGIAVLIGGVFLAGIVAAVRAKEDGEDSRTQKK